MPITPAYVELLERLVAQPTVSSASNLEAVELLSEVLQDAGGRVRHQRSEDGHKANLIAWMGPQPNAARHGLTLSGHLDVVPTPEEGWESPPFTLADSGDRWRGRGTADMKGFLALATRLAVTTARREGSLNAPLALLFTYDEEVGSLGAQHFAESWDGPLLPRATVIGEPTELRMVRMHKGHLRLTIGVHGEAAHSAHPRRGRNAIEATGPLIAALTRLRRDLESEPTKNAQYFPQVPFITLNIGQIEGGTALNVVPHRCQVEVGLRPLPGVDLEAVTARIHRAARQAVGEKHLDFQVGHLSPPLETSVAAPIHQALGELLDRSETVSAAFSSDAGFLSQAGHDCLLFGPGSIGVAHRANESLPKRDVERAEIVLRELIDRFCRH